MTGIAFRLRDDAIPLMLEAAAEIDRLRGLLLRWELSKRT